MRALGTAVGVYREICTYFNFPANRIAADGMFRCQCDVRFNDNIPENPGIQSLCERARPSRRVMMTLCVYCFLPQLNRKYRNYHLIARSAAAHHERLIFLLFYSHSARQPAGPSALSLWAGALAHICTSTAGISVYTTRYIVPNICIVHAIPGAAAPTPLNKRQR